jgi:hypothetical protein
VTGKAGDFYIRCFLPGKLYQSVRKRGVHRPGRQAPMSDWRNERKGMTVVYIEARPKAGRKATRPTSLAFDT